MHDHVLVGSTGNVNPEPVVETAVDVGERADAVVHLVYVTDGLS